MTLDEIVNLLEAEDENNIDDIILFPPEDGDYTDEDSGGENDANQMHLPSRMLRSVVEVETRSTDTNNTAENEEEQIEEETEEPAKKKRKKKQFTVKKWIDDTSIFSPCGKGDCEEDIPGAFATELSATECFELFLTEDIVKFITDMSNRYALQRNHTLNATTDETRVYIGILLMTGYLAPKYMRLLWEKKSDKCVFRIMNLFLQV